jgi:hypothetical protein
MVTVKNGERSGTVNGQERLTVPDRFLNAQKRSGTVMVTVRNGQERWTVRNGERYETIILYKINGQKRLQNYVHLHVSKTKESLYNRR